MTMTVAMMVAFIYDLSLSLALLSFEAASNAGGQVAEMVINYSSGEPSLASKSQERLRQTSAKSGRGQAGSGFLSTEET